MFVTAQINNFKVRPMPLEKIDPNKIKGYDLIKELYANVFMVAIKKSGKTTCIFNILKKCINKDTRLIFFGSTINRDPGYKYILKYFKKRGHDILKYTAIVEDGVDQLREIMDSMGQVESDSDSDSEVEAVKPPIKFISVDGDEDEEKKRQYKPKKIAPEIVFIFDDLSSEMRTPSFTKLIKSNRHYKCKVLISSQNVKDIDPKARENINILLLFKNIRKKYLDSIYEDFKINLEPNVFQMLYDDATREKYSFLYIDTNDHEYRKNFSQLYLQV